MGDGKQEPAIQGASRQSGFEIFEYPAAPCDAPEPAWGGWLEADEEQGSKPADGQSAERPGGPDSEESTRAYEKGRARGRDEGRELERAAQVVAAKPEEERRKRQLGGFVESFARERDRFLAAVEQEVVKLALAVAARILRREAQMDPLLLSGAVRVALGQLAGASEVRLRVPQAEVQLWQEAIALFPNLNLRTEVTAGEGMRLGDCVMESKAGSVDLGVRAQLVEIERGFFDRGGSDAKRDAVAVSAVPGGSAR